MAEQQFWKEGFLQKAGKHKFQGWRKRWFVLNSDSLKYYNSGDEYNDSNLLGTVPLVEIQSLVSIKTPKHAFEIITKSRTYSLSAKSDLERDDWIITLRKASDDKRDVDYSQRNSMASIHNYQSVDSAAQNDPDYSMSSSDKDKLKKSSKKKTKNSIKSSTVTETENTLPPADTVENNDNKPRSSTLIPLVSEKETELKPRAASMADSLTRANSMLRKMSVDSSGDNVENIYHELEQELDNDESEDELENECQDPTPPAPEITLPPPRDGCEMYAFHEIRQLLESISTDVLMSVDLKQVAKQNKLKYDPEEEFLAFSLLKSYCLK